MSVLAGTVVSYSGNVTATNQAGKQYAAWRLIYTDGAGEVKTLQKPATGLKFNRALAAQLGALQPGDDIIIVQEKNDAGFLDVKSVTKGSEAPAPSLAPKDKQPGTTSAPSAGNRNFETSEERAQKQVYIARQSSLERAVTLYPKKSPQEIIEVAEFFKDYIFDGLPKAAPAPKEYTDDNFHDDIPM